MYSVKSVYVFSPEEGSDGRPLGHLKTGRPLPINVGEDIRAVTAFEAEIFAGYLCSRLVRDRFPKEYDSINAWFRSKTSDEASAIEPSENIRAELDSIYEDVLTIVEFALNRLTTYNDDSIEQIMTGVRFSLAYYMRMDRSRSENHIVSKKVNTIRFGKKELRSITSLAYKTQWVSSDGSFPKAYDEIMEVYSQTKKTDLENMKQFYRIVHNTIDQSFEKDSVYVEVLRDGLTDECFDGLLSQCWNFSNTDQAGCRRHLVPLMKLIECLMPLCKTEPMLSLQNENDYQDMSGDIIVANSALLGFVGKRKNKLNCGQKTTSEVLSRYETDDGNAVKDCLMFVRILHSILSSSEIRKSGKAHQIDLRFRASNMLRMMDAEMFGKDVYLPNMIFLTESDRHYRGYMAYLKDIGFVAGKASHGYRFNKILDPLNDLEVQFNPSGRVRNVKIKGCFGQIRSVSHEPPENFKDKNLNDFKMGTILVCEPSQKADLVRAIRFATHAADGDRDRIWRIVTLLPEGSRETYTSVDISDAHIIEVGIADYGQLFNTHSNGILARTENALESSMNGLYAKYSVEKGEQDALVDAIPSDTLVGCLEKIFIGYRNCMTSEISRMRL